MEDGEVKDLHHPLYAEKRGGWAIFEGDEEVDADQHIRGAAEGKPL